MSVSEDQMLASSPRAATTGRRGVEVRARGPVPKSLRKCSQQRGGRAETAAGRGRRAQNKKWTQGYGLKTCTKVVVDGANVCWAFGREKRAALATGDAVVRPDVEGLRIVLAYPVWDALGIEPIVFLPTSCVRYDNWERYECSAESDTLFDAHKLVSVENGCIARTLRACQIGGSEAKTDPLGSATHLRHKAQRSQARAKGGGGAGIQRRGQARSKDAGIKSRDDILLLRCARERERSSQPPQFEPLSDASSSSSSSSRAPSLRYAQKHNAWVLSNDRFR